MGRVLKILLGFCAGTTLMIVGVLVVAGIAIARAAETETDGVATLAAEIADFTPPETYVAELGLKMLGWTAVTYRTPSADGHLLLVQGPGDIALDRGAVDDLLFEGKLERDSLKTLALDRAKASLDFGDEPPNRFEPRRLRTAGAKDVVIKDEPTKLRVREGLNSRDVPYREVSGVFQGKDGPVLLVLTSPISGWNEPALDAFIASIR